jgi:hypothetical protein
MGILRFFLHVQNGIGFVPDKEGVCLCGLDAARAQAIVSIRSILAEEVGFLASSIPVVGSTS